MEKVVYAVWPGTHAGERERDEALGRHLLQDVGPALVRAGALGVQVNVIDDAVAAGAALTPAGLRRTTMDDQMGAVVSVWLESAVTRCRAPFDRLLAEGGRRLAGYLVTESEPLVDATAPAVGMRSPGFSQLAFLRRPARLGVDEWRERWLDHHTPVAIETQSTVEYRQHRVVRSLHADAPSVDAIVEERFPIEALTDWMVFYDAEGDRARFTAHVEAMVASTATFLDHETDLDVLPTSQYVLRRPGG